MPNSLLKSELAVALVGLCITAWEGAAVSVSTGIKDAPIHLTKALSGLFSMILKMN